MNGHNKWILDAKAPIENIKSGKNVEQAYSYAIHPDIRVNYYALCNGREFVVFHISRIKPELVVEMQKINEHWLEIVQKLGATAFTEDRENEIHPDFGLKMLKVGATSENEMHFPLVPVSFIQRMGANTFTMAISMQFDGILDLIKI